jgi:hypothetical protein
VGRVGDAPLERLHWQQCDGSSLRAAVWRAWASPTDSCVHCGTVRAHL